jgi:hypothetical protein
MSCVFCDYTAPSASPPQNYQTALGTKTTKTFGFPQFVLIRGDQVIADPSLITDWTTICTAGELEVGPCGVITLGTPSFTTSTDDSACGDTEVLETIYTPTFSTYWVDNTNLTHLDYFESILAGYSCMQIVLFDCDGNVIMNKAGRDVVNGVTTAPITETIGFDFGMIQTPHVVQGDANLEKWQFQIEIKLSGEDMLRAVSVPGLLDALIAC